jgi:WD40 repeat protein
MAGATVITVAPDGVRLWNAIDGELQHEWQGDYEVAAASADGRVLVAQAGDDSSLTVYDLGTGRPLRRLESPNETLRALVISGDLRVVVGASEERLWFWDLASGRALYRRQDLRTVGVEALAGRWTAGCHRRRHNGGHR